MGLQQFERRLERLVEGVFAKAFRSGLQPVELGRRLTREMDQGRTVGVRGTVAPNHFTFALSAADLKQFDTFRDALVRELAEAAREHAKSEGYRFMGPVEIELVEQGNVSTGTFLVAGEVREGVGGGPVGALVLPEGRRIVVGDDPITIGRLAECDIPLTGDTNVSRRHAEIRRDGDEFVVADLDSLNGTRVNGAGVKTRRLADGDEITVGLTTLRFETS
jgi:hypothetical protein